MNDNRMTSITFIFCVCKNNNTVWYFYFSLNNRYMYTLNSCAFIHFYQHELFKLTCCFIFL